VCWADISQPAGVARRAAGRRPLDFFLAWQAAISFKLQLYFDFSGYSEMALARPGCSASSCRSTSTRPTARSTSSISGDVAHDPDVVLLPTSISRSAAPGGVWRLYRNLLITLSVRAMAWRACISRCEGPCRRDDGANHAWRRFWRPINAWWSHATARLVTFSF